MAMNLAEVRTTRCPLWRIRAVQQYTPQRTDSLGPVI